MQLSRNTEPTMGHFRTLDPVPSGAEPTFLTLNCPDPKLRRMISARMDRAKGDPGRRDAPRDHVEQDRFGGI
jgi:hypothetical protein